MTRLHILVNFDFLKNKYFNTISDGLIWNFQAVLFVSVYSVASRPTEMANSSAESVNARLTFGNPIELPGSSPLSNRFKSN